MEKPKIRQTPASPKNFTKSKGPRHIEYLIIHVMQGTLKGTISWFANEKARSSAHYSIGEKGEIVQHVSDNDVAWHAGNAAFNKMSIGIELEGFVHKEDNFTEPMMTSLVDLCRYLCREHGISPFKIIGHCDVPHPKNPDKKGGLNGHQDPGPYFNWTAFIASVKGGNDRENSNEDAPV